MTSTQRLIVFHTILIKTTLPALNREGFFNRKGEEDELAGHILLIRIVHSLYWKFIRNAPGIDTNFWITLILSPRQSETSANSG